LLEGAEFTAQEDHFGGNRMPVEKQPKLVRQTAPLAKFLTTDFETAALEFYAHRAQGDSKGI
jgi:hypothetical protein